MKRNILTVCICLVALGLILLPVTFSGSSQQVLAQGAGQNINRQRPTAPVTQQRPVPVQQRQVSHNDYVAGIRRMPYARPIAYPVKPIKFTIDTTPTVDMRPQAAKDMLKVRSQGGRNTCSVHAIAFLLEYEYAKQNLGLVTGDLSEEFLNAATNLAANSNDDGDFFHNINLGYQKYGMCPQNMVPNQATFDPKLNIDQSAFQVGQNFTRLTPHFIKENASFTSDPNDDDNPYGLTDAQMKAIISALDKDHPVAAGGRWVPSSKYATHDVFGIPLTIDSPVEDLTSGHSVAIVGYKKSNAFPGGGYFIFRNSWGEGFADKGYGCWSFDYVKNNIADVIWYS